LSWSRELQGGKTERWIGILRRECLDHLLITGPRHLAGVLREYGIRYNTHRLHRSLQQHPPLPHPLASQPLHREETAFTSLFRGRGLHQAAHLVRCDVVFAERLPEPALW
jgi:hypothetical protein